MTTRIARPLVGPIVDQHVADLAVLWNTRRDHTWAPHVALLHLTRVDNRLAAHQDGCVIAGSEGLRLLLGQLIEPAPPAIFAATVVALETQDGQGFNHAATVAEALTEGVEAVISALGWVERDRLSGIGKQLLESPSPFRRRLGLAACRLHGVDPGAALLAGLKDESPVVRAEALRTAGTIGRRQLVSAIAATQDDDPDCQFRAAWSAVLLGDRERALDALTRAGFADGPHRARAFRLALQAMTPPAAHHALQQLAGSPENLRWLIQGCGINGDPTYVPWLLKHMADDKTARLAGEAFSLITGTDLALLDLERKPPEDVDSGPNDDPEDANVEMDPDDGLPWPDPDRIARWWEQNSAHFQPGKRWFVGAPVSRAYCVDVLKSGYQRQRILAAHYLCLLEPGTPLFNTSAPAWRQQKLLAEMR